MENKGAEVNKEIAQRRAESFYLVYAAMGSERSLEKLKGVLADIGLDISLNTLKSYSARHDWVERTSQIPTLPIVNSDVISEMNQRHVSLGRFMQEVALEGLENFNTRTLSAGDASRLLKSGSEIERLASGHVRSKYELAIELLNPIISEIVQLYTRVNVLDDPDTRVRDFVTGADAICDKFIGDVFPREAGK